MYHSVASFLHDWKMEKAATLRVFRELTDASLSRQVDPEGRSLGFIAWHIVLTIGEMGTRAGLPLKAPPEEAAEPTSAARIASAFEAASCSLEEQLPKTWNDAMLEDEVSMYGQAWKRSAVLASLILHQAHHRGQMTVLPRDPGFHDFLRAGPLRICRI